MENPSPSENPSSAPDLRKSEDPQGSTASPDPNAPAPLPPAVAPPAAGAPPPQTPGQPAPPAQPPTDPNAPMPNAQDPKADLPDQSKESHTGELVAALKNAVDRGQTVEQAVQTLKNAGYSDAMIQEAQQAYASNPAGQPMQASVPTQAPAGKKSSSGNKILIIGLIVLLLLAAAGSGAYFFLP